MTNNSHLCSNLTASYKYCCYGMHCPSCAVRLYLHVLDRAFLVHSSLQMNCITHAYDVTVGAFSKPGRYTTKVTRPTFGYYRPRYDDYHCPYPTPHTLYPQLYSILFLTTEYFSIWPLQSVLHSKTNWWKGFDLTHDWAVCQLDFESAVQLHKMTNSRAVFIARIHACLTLNVGQETQYLASMLSDTFVRF